MLTFASVALLCSVSPQSVAEADAAQTPSATPAAQFSQPVLLTVDGEPLGGKQMYPSPRLYDIDRDGSAELVVGDLRGAVLVSERKADAELDAWSELEPLVTGGRALKFNNW